MTRWRLQRLGAALVIGGGVVLALTPTPRWVPANGAPPNPCPPEMALTAGTCMDRYEARLLERATDGSLTPFSPFARPKNGAFVAESRAGVRPQGYISRSEAESACLNAGKRL